VDFLRGLNPQQKEAVTHLNGPLLLLAGAGSGKTRVVTHRIAHLISEHHIPGPAILAVTFTNKAAGEMRDRVQKLLGDDSTRSSPFVSTFHSFCVRLLRRNGQALADIRSGFTTSFNIYDDDDQTSLIKAIYREMGLDDKSFMQHRAALSRISHAKNHKETPDSFYKASKDPKMSRLAVVFDRYEARLRQANAVDFDDLLLESVRLLRHDEQTRGSYNRRFEFIHIDEYQDTNRSQYELMRLLTESHKNLCVVGDEDQSIYGWRGANIRNILDFEKDYPSARVIRLEQNYRSTKNILEAASNLIAKNTQRKGKWLWTEHETGARIGAYEAYDAENEALWIADTIERLLRQNPGYRVAVLYRTNFQSRQIEEALRRYNRKYLIVGGFSFYQRAEVKDLIAYLKALATAQDSISLLRILNVPARGIGKSTVEQMEHYALEHNLSLWSAIGEMVERHLFPTRAEAAVVAFRKLMDEMRDGVHARPVNETLEGIVERTGYRRMLNDGTPESESRLGNIEELINAAADAAERGEGLAEFLDHAALVSESDALDESAQVCLLTVHNAKGLEFPVVFIAGLEDGLFPHIRAVLMEDASAADRLEEERRLCYVAMTRAEKRLYLSWAKFRRRYGGGSPEQSIPSRFLKDVPQELVEPLNPRSAQAREVDLYAEQHEARETVRKNLYTGKTYNSLDNIAQFFSERGMPPPRGITPSSDSPPKSAPVSASPAAPVARPAAQPVRRKKPFGPGSSVNHPKYGRGTILRREGEGDDAKLTVSFPGYGLKKLIQKYAGITADE
jgi:DNA helicase-2/ATP-dependent DNA helicase PcrA